MTEVHKLQLSPETALILTQLKSSGELLRQKRRRLSVLLAIIRTAGLNLHQDAYTEEISSLKEIIENLESSRTLFLQRCQYQAALLGERPPENSKDCKVGKE